MSHADPRDGKDSEFQAATLNDEPLVAMRAITKRFSNVVANDAVDLILNAGEIHALLGENGAGKTTLMNILFGLYPADSGSISIASRDVVLGSPHEARALGVGMVHQHFMLISDFTVAENVVLGSHVSTLSRLRRHSLESLVAASAKRFEMTIPVEQKVADLSIETQQRVELLRLLHAGAEIIILDEPTAVLGPNEVDQLFATLRTLASNGAAIVIITHKLREVMSIADRVTVLRKGRVVARHERGEFSEQVLARAMVGRELPPAVAQAIDWNRETAVVALAVEDLVVPDSREGLAVDNLSFEIRAGEVLGVAGVEGNGQQELCEALSGVVASSHGTIQVHGHDITGASPAVLHSAGIRAISSDRAVWDIVPDLTVAENLALSSVRTGRYARRGFLRRLAMRRDALVALKEHDIRPRDPDLVVGRLSGGNQQKVVIARECTDETGVLIASQPTRGLDPGAATFVRNRILEMKNKGCAVLLNSMDLDELMTMADRVIVLYRGQLALEAPTAGLEMSRLAAAMTGTGMR